MIFDKFDAVFMAILFIYSILKTVWRYNKVICLFSCNYHLETPLWNYHDSCFVTNIQGPSQWSHLVIFFKGKGIMTSQWTLYSMVDFQVTSLQCQLLVWRTASVIITLQWHFQIKISKDSILGKCIFNF